MPEALARTAFFALLGATSLAKGIGFGGVLVAATVGLVLLWDRDRRTTRSLLSPTGLALAAALALAWPTSIIGHHPSAMTLWTTHVTDRLAAQPRHFASEPWWQFALSPLAQTLPWTPFALIALRTSWRRARAEPGGPDRLLWAWAVAPIALISLASVHNAHYLIHALPPWSIWAALGLRRLDERLHGRARRSAIVGFTALGLAYALGFTALGPRFDRRGVEWSWYATVARSLQPDEPLVLLYDDWDRAPYPTPFGPVPHDLAVRLFYLDRPARWGRDIDTSPIGPLPCAVVARERDLPAILRLGRAEVIARGPTTRWDRSYLLLRVTGSPARATPRTSSTPRSPPAG